MDQQQRRAAAAAYKARRQQGGVYQIRNTRTGRILLRAACDLRGSRNRFAFAQMTGSCVDYALQHDWAQNGSDFVFEVLEELQQKEAQTDAEFRADIDTLLALWQEKLAGVPQY